MTLRAGDVGRGVALAFELHDIMCCRECAAILEGLKQWQVRGTARPRGTACPRVASTWQDAARLYERGDQPDKAAAIYIRIKNWGTRPRATPSTCHASSTCHACARPRVTRRVHVAGSAAPLMARITAPRLHAEFAKAKEADGRCVHVALDPLARPRGTCVHVAYGVHVARSPRPSTWHTRCPSTWHMASTWHTWRPRGRYEEAVVAYERANDLDAVVRD